MRTYQEDGRELLCVRCNQCGRSLRVEQGILKEGCYQGHRIFDYFSGRDGISEDFDLCEECYETMIRSFQLPVEQREVTELL